MKTALVLGGNGFIGHHMARRLKSEGYWVRVVDIKEYEYGVNDYADEVILYDLTDPQNVNAVMRDAKTFSYYKKPFTDVTPFDEVYNFACVMGGAGFVFTGDHDAQIMHDSVCINANVAYYAHYHKAKKVFFSSSACMYPSHIQEEENNPGLSEEDAYPAGPDSEYGWEKLFSERMYMAYARNHGMNIRIARFHNIYGPEGTYKGGKEKAPAAICRKVIERTARSNKTEAFVRWMGGTTTGTPSIEIWGDGEQTRSFLYIDDCIDAVRLLMDSEHKTPINIGSEEMVSINSLADLAISFAGRPLKIRHIDGPVGVRGRNSDNTLIRQVLKWEPKHTLRSGLELTYSWIKSQV